MYDVVEFFGTEQVAQIEKRSVVKITLDQLEVLLVVFFLVKPSALEVFRMNRL